MNIFQIIFTIILQSTTLKIANAIAKHNDENSKNSPAYQYFLYFNTGHNDNNKIQNILNVVNNKAKYYTIFNKKLKQAQRRFRDLKKDREERKQAELLKTQQERKIKEITEFMKEYPVTTNFLYDELQRIKRQRIVKDDLRRMVEYLEKPGKEGIRSKILKCYQVARKTEVLPGDIWGMETNNMVINVLKDPYNYGYIN